MAKIDVVELDSELKKGKIRPLYVIAGEEAYLAGSALSRIEESIGAADLARHVFTGKEVSPHELLDTIRSVPLLGGRPVTIVRDAEGMSKDAFEKLADYIQKPLDSSTLILVASKLDGRSRFMQAASKNTATAVVECKPLYANQVPSWINMELQRRGKRISQDAARYLADIVGQDLGQVAQAVERLTLFVGNRPTVDLKDIEESIAETTQRSIFELTDAIGRRKLSRAISVLGNLIEYSTPPVLILNMIARHFRILTRAREVEKKAGGAEIASYLGVNPFFAKDYLEQSRLFSPSELKKDFGILARCDRELKSSRIPKERILERLIFDLLKAPQRHRDAEKNL